MASSSPPTLWYLTGGGDGGTTTASILRGGGWGLSSLLGCLVGGSVLRLGLVCLSCRSCCGSISLEVLVGLLEFESEIEYFQTFETELKVN